VTVFALPEPKTRLTAKKAQKIAFVLEIIFWEIDIKASSRTSKDRRTNSDQLILRYAEASDKTVLLPEWLPPLGD
jgi:hypothetical protein